MPIEVVPYDPAWPDRFEQLRSVLVPALGEVAIAIEHVGSTSVPSLAAKPVIDIDAIFRSPADVPEAIARLGTVGYRHLRRLWAIAGREAFGRPPRLPAHNLYLCPAGIESLRNHLTIRDHLRTHAAARDAYGALKMQLATEVDDIDDYVERKSAFLLGILEAEGFDPEALERIPGREPGLRRASDRRGRRRTRRADLGAVDVAQRRVGVRRVVHVGADDAAHLVRVMLSAGAGRCRPGRSHRPGAGSRASRRAVPTNSPSRRAPPGSAGSCRSG